MNKKVVLSDVWLKASILGANWAAFEIILGSFLHNLNIPFKGNILTAIGLIIMISVSYKWKDKGLFWRSGLICALMKTMSPSAVIFGPMVAIFMEALLLEVSVRLIGRNIAGFFLGSALAMSWILVQKIINLILFYGLNIVDIYADLLKFAERQINIQFDTFWLPVLILLSMYILFGLFATLTGLKIANDISRSQEINLQDTSQQIVDLKNKQKGNFPFSIGWLIFSSLGLIGTIILIGKSPFYIWMPVSAVLVMLWVLRYKRGMRQISKSRFWIFFVVITALSAIFISSFNGSENTWLDGVMVGLQMNFRAAVVIVGFSVLGTELYNPKIRNFMMKTSFKQLPDALELAFESLPFVIAHLPEARIFVKNPSEVIKVLVSYAESRFKELKNKQQAKVYIIKGDVSEGKTNFVAELSHRLQGKAINVGGFYSPRIMEDGQTTGYDLVSIETGERFDFLRIKKKDDSEVIGKYEINTETLNKGKHILTLENNSGKKVVIIDEIGRLELNNQGWKDSLENLLAKSDLSLILTVRTELTDQVVEKFGIKNFTIFPAYAENIKIAEDAIIMQK